MDAERAMAAVESMKSAEDEASDAVKALSEAAARIKKARTESDAIRFVLVSAVKSAKMVLEVIERDGKITIHDTSMAMHAIETLVKAVISIGILKRELPNQHVITGGKLKNQYWTPPFKAAEVGPGATGERGELTWAVRDSYHESGSSVITYLSQEEAEFLAGLLNDVYPLPPETPTKDDEGMEVSHP